jgi:hypothetical protein
LFLPSLAFDWLCFEENQAGKSIEERQQQKLKEKLLKNILKI